MNADAENLVMLVDQCATESVGRIIQFLNADASHNYALVPSRIIRNCHVVALCKTLLTLSQPDSLFGDEGELLKARVEEFDTYSCQAFGMLLTISERLRTWEPGVPEAEIVEALIDSL